jgi:heme/copper-type cytochrome/quinol oxidase subunit 4
MRGPVYMGLARGLWNLIWIIIAIIIIIVLIRFLFHLLFILPMTSNGEEIVNTYKNIVAIMSP